MKIVIYQTSDLHGYVYPTNYVKDQPLGILKIGTYIKEDEKQYDASLKIDCGDLIQGSALANYLTKQEFEVNPIIQGMEAIGYDAYVIGNHEFNYGVEYLARSYGFVQEKVLNSNLVGLPLATKPYQIFDVEGFKIGCIGITTSYIPNWEQPKNIPGVSFLDPVDMYRKYEEELKEQADFIIVAYHGGFERSLDEQMEPTENLTKENQASELLQEFDSIDLILSGHQHRGFAVKIKDTVCMQPLHNGQNFTKVILDTETGDMEYELIDVKNLTGPLSPELEQIFTSVNSKLESYLDQKIGAFKESLVVENLFEARLHGHPFINFLHEVQLDASGADFSAVSLFDSTIGFHKEVTMREVLMNYPYANTLKVLKITGATLKEAMEKSATYFVLGEEGKVEVNPSFLVPKVQHYNYDLFGGVEYVIDLYKPFGERVTSIKKQGEPIVLDQEYTIVLSNYRATNTSVYPCYEGAELVKELSVDISELLIDYFRSHACIEVTKTSPFHMLYHR